MANKLESDTEDYFIELFNTNTTLQSESIRKHDDDDDADSEGIVVRAMQNDNRLDGPKGFDVEVNILQRSLGKDPEHDSLVADEIVKSVFDATPGLTDIEDNFTYLLILDETKEERSDDKKLRIRERIFNVIARNDPVV